MATILNALSTVYARRRYLLFSLAVALMAAAALFASTSLPGQSLQSWLYSTPIHAKFLVAFGSLMLGLIAAVQLYSWRHFKTSRKRHSVTTAGAFFSTLVATACCSPFLLPFVGLAGAGGSFIFLFHRYQLPVVLASSALLLLALHYSCKVVECEECRVKIGADAKE